MAVPSVTGSIQQLKDSTGTPSTTWNIPADTDLVLVMAAYFDGNPIDGMTFGGSAMTKEIEETGAGSQNVAIFYLANPTTGASVSWSANLTSIVTPSEGIIYFCVPLKDVDVSGDPTTDSQKATGSTTPTTPAITTTTNDTLYCVTCGWNGATDSGYGSGQTELADSTPTFNGDQGSVGTKAGVSGTTTMQVSGPDSYTAVAAVSVKGSAAAGDLSISKSEAVAVAESTSLTNALTGISETEAVAVGEAVAMYLGMDISESDAVTVADAASIDPLLLGGISESDTVTLADTAALGGLLLDIAESDTVTLADSASVDALLLDISESEAVTITDTAGFEALLLNVSTADAVTLAEDKTLSVSVLAGDLSISEADGIAVGDTAGMSLGDLGIPVTLDNPDYQYTGVKVVNG